MIFDKNISCYANVHDNVGTVRSLSSFLFDEEQKDLIMQIRQTEDKQQRSELKKQLSCATLSGLFAPTRKAENLKAHSGFICIDIDGQDNPAITDWEDIKRQLAVIPQIAYAGLSVSGHGLFLLIPISYPSCHKQHFLQLQEDFQKMGIVVDRNCKDVCRLRTKSYDAAPYVNEQAQSYNKVKVEQRPVYHRTDFPVVADETIARVQQCCKQIDIKHIDLTSTYEDWLNIGFSLASLGEQGRQFFHICSRQYDGYRPVETDKKFTNLLASGRKFTIGTFFQKCKQNGVLW